MEADEVSSTRAKFPSVPGQVFAVYHVLRNLADFQDGAVIGLESSDPLAVVGMALTDEKQTRVMVANLTGGEKSVSISGLGENASVWEFNALNTTAANSDPETFHLRSGTPLLPNMPLDVPPYGIVRIEWALQCSSVSLRIT